MLTLASLSGRFVEFFETKPKSLQFFPTWEQLLKNEAKLASDYPDAPFQFAQVDCHVSGDLCIREGVEVTPRLFT